ncbi:VOC family protein [Sunxiuqinia sp. sy24]|uniref:VOC family protein n=1 Tax=Sunxiuqinia sp. sy24 TaxID=3461495 RepID=UPI0040461AAB
MEKIKDAVVWAEIPVLNFDRAKAFYSKIFDFDMLEEMMGSHRMGFLPMEPQAKGVGGAIVQGQGYTPSALGTKVYLNGGSDLSQILDRVNLADGKIIQAKTKITDEIGYFAVFEDTEGNHICLHSVK